MSRFVVTGTQNRKRTTLLELEASSLSIGTRSTCGLTLRDPVAAERHCRIEEGLRGFALSDVGSTTGTYLNGTRVLDPAPLREGDLFVLGTTRVTVTAATTGELHLDVEEKAFEFQSAKLIKKTGEWVQGDREAWVESEVTFSRYPALRTSVWSAILIALLLPLVVDLAASPGPLHSTHDALFVSTPADPALAEIAGQGCQACHVSFARGGTRMSKCYACHAEILDRHPFQAEPHEQGWGEDACATCHVDHQGSARSLQLVDLSDLWPARTVSVPVHDGRFVPTADETASACADCHEDVDFAAPGRVETFLASVEPSPAPTRTVALAFDGFSHASHDRAGIDCGACHVPADHGELDPDEDPRALRDFAPVDFEGCMGCHADEAARPELVTSTEWAARAPDYDVRWHGAQDDRSRCTTCHRERYAAELRTTERRRIEWLDRGGSAIPSADLDPKLLFAYTIRHHTAEFEDARARVQRGELTGADDDCQRCHVDGDWASAGEPREGRFHHGLHLTELTFTDQVESIAASAPGRELLREQSGACDECHAGVASARELAQPFYAAETDSCATCHRSDPGGDASVPRVIDDPDRMRLGALVEQVEFPHDLHTNWEHASLQSGCYSCHAFERTDVEFRSPMTTPESVRTCVQCHDRTHENVGGGSCQVCHAAGDPVFHAELSDPSWSQTKAWPALNAFSHFSSGHLDRLRSDCQSCHTGVVDATTIAEVEIPTEGQASCRECHVGERQRFHWR